MGKHKISVQIGQISANIRVTRQDNRGREHFVEGMNVDIQNLDVEIATLSLHYNVPLGEIEQITKDSL